MSQQKTIPSPEDEQYLKEMGEYFLSLSIHDLAMVLRNPVSQDDAMEAAYRMPQLMEHVHQAFEAMPSPLTPEEEQSAFERGTTLAKRMFAKASKAAPTPFESACECLSALLQKPMKTVEAMCVGWSDPSLQVAMAASAGLELKAKLGRSAAAHVGKVTLEANPFGVGSIRGDFDRPASLRVALFDIPRKKMVPFTVGGEKQAVVVIKAGRTRKVSISLPATVRRQDFLLVALAPQEETL